MKVHIDEGDISAGRHASTQYSVISLQNERFSLLWPVLTDAVVFGFFRYAII